MGIKAKPLLAQSFFGSVNLFYDANEGPSQQLLLLSEAAYNIVRVKATKWTISLTSKSDKQMWSAKIGMRDFICSDEHVKSLGRTVRSLLFHDDGGGEGKKEERRELSFLAVSYEFSGVNEETDIGKRVGSPRVVTIPDAISEVLQFVSIEKGKIQKMSWKQETG